MSNAPSMLDAMRQAMRQALRQAMLGTSPSNARTDGRTDVRKGYVERRRIFQLLDAREHRPIHRDIHTWGQAS